MIYMPMIPEAAAAMLACARIGAVHSVCFGGFSPESLAGRIEDCGARVVVTADEGVRGGKRIPLKANVDAACDLANGAIERVIVVARTGAEIAWHPQRDLRWEDEREALSPDCPAKEMAAEDPLFILYTRVDRKTHWVGPHYWRLCDLWRDDLRLGVRRAEYLFGHRAFRLDHRATSTPSMAPCSTGDDGISTGPNPRRGAVVGTWTGSVTIFYTAPTAIRA